VNREKYLERIGIGGQIHLAEAESLRRLQRAHLLSIPFENLDIHWKRPIVLDTGTFYDKIVENERGGFCYELNGLFKELLVSLEFKTRLISARVFNGTEYGPEYDHAALIVTIGDNEYLADVGFGDFTAEPLRFVLDEEQQDATGTFVIRTFDDKYLEVAKKDGDVWKSEYIFQDIARDLSEFTEMCDFQQYSPESHFTKGKLCSLMTESGRKTLTDSSYIVTQLGQRIENDLSSESEFEEVLVREFRMKKPK
jgi:N-hydroxyarylamine O-acetyltransferase